VLSSLLSNTILFYNDNVTLTPQAAFNGHCISAQYLCIYVYEINFKAYAILSDKVKIMYGPFICVIKFITDGKNMRACFLYLLGKIVA